MPDPTARVSAALAERYQLERELGQGGMATVYLAQDIRHHRKVAVKVLRPELVAVIGAERFLAEIRTTANLQHPHILPTPRCSPSRSTAPPMPSRLPEPGTGVGRSPSARPAASMSWRWPSSRRGSPTPRSWRIGSWLMPRDMEASRQHPTPSPRRGAGWRSYTRSAGSAPRPLMPTAGSPRCWKDADPALQPAVQDVRQRMAALAGEH